MKEKLYKFDWIEKAIGKKMMWNPVNIGTRFGRDLYTICWWDGTEGDYFIDFDKMEIEKY